MSFSPTRVLPVSLLVALAMVLTAFVSVASAAPSATSSSSAGLANHTEECNVTFDAGGNVLLDGSALTGAAATALDAALAGNASLAAALDAAADADADACVQLNLTLVPLALSIDAHVGACGAVVVGATSTTVGGVELSTALLNPDTAALLAVAAAADADACVSITVAGSSVTVNVQATACVTAVLNGQGDLVVSAGGSQLVVDGASVTGDIDADAAVEVALTLTASANAVTDATVSLTAALAALPGCGGAAPSASATATPGGGSGPGGGGSPGASASGAAGRASATPLVSQLSNTASSNADGTASFPAVLLATLLLVGSSMALGAAGVQNRRRG